MSKREFTPAQAFGILIQRIDKRKSILTRAGDEMAYRIAQAELEVVRSQLEQAQKYFVMNYAESTIRNEHK